MRKGRLCGLLLFLLLSRVAGAQKGQMDSLFKKYPGAGIWHSHYDDTALLTHSFFKETLQNYSIYFHDSVTHQVVHQMDMMKVATDSLHPRDSFVNVMNTYFGYDPLGHLTHTWTYANDEKQQLLNEEMRVYDRSGRVKEVTQRNGGISVVQEYSYDPAGRLLSVRTKHSKLVDQYLYGDKGQLLRINTMKNGALLDFVEFKYDGDRLVERDTGDTHLIFRTIIIYDHAGHRRFEVQTNPFL